MFVEQPLALPGRAKYHPLQCKVGGWQMVGLCNGGVSLGRGLFLAGLPRHITRPGVARAVLQTALYFIN